MTNRPSQQIRKAKSTDNIITFSKKRNIIEIVLVLYYNTVIFNNK